MSLIYMGTDVSPWTLVSFSLTLSSWPISKHKLGEIFLYGQIVPEHLISTSSQSPNYESFLFFVFFLAFNIYIYISLSIILFFLVIFNQYVDLLSKLPNVIYCDCQFRTIIYKSKSIQHNRTNSFFFFLITIF